jgi:nicotinate-nucleotide adenylyltransferase
LNFHCRNPPIHTVSLIIGQDNLQSFKKWKNYEQILKSFHLYVYPRPGCDSGDLASHPHVHVTNAPLMELSSTFIRNAIRDKKDVRYYLPAKVWQEIELMHFYEK